MNLFDFNKYNCEYYNKFNFKKLKKNSVNDETKESVYYRLVKRIKSFHYKIDY